MPDEMELPQPRRPRESQQDPYLREIEIDPHKYLPDDVYRDPITALPAEMKADLRPIKQALRDKEKEATKPAHNGTYVLRGVLIAQVGSSR